MTRSQRWTLLLVVAGPLVALVPLGRILYDWVQVERVAPAVLTRVADRGFDWVRWEDREGEVVAAYVFPRGPGARAGLREGDVFLSIEGAMLFDAESVEGAVGGVAPGTTVAYEVVRDGAITRVAVPLARYPTFAYPLAPGLWTFSLWGFLVGAFFHALGLAIAVPLARSTLRARYALAVIAVSALWIGSNLLRLVLMEVFGPPGAPGSAYDAALRGLTVVGLTGWILFPALLLGTTLSTTGTRAFRAFRRARFVRLVPPLVLGALALVVTIRGGVGPLTLDGLVVPILFYAGIYVALATAVPLVAGGGGPNLPGGVSRTGSLLTVGAALGLALAVLDVVPLVGEASAGAVGWLVVAAQLLSLAPVVLVTLATLRYGKVDAVLTRGLGVLVAAGVFFFVVVAALYAVRPLVAREGASWPVVAGLFAVVLALVVYGGAAWVRRHPPALFATGRGRARARVAQFQERMPLLLDPDALARETLRVAGEAVGARSAVLYFRLPGEDGWRTAHYHPEPPYLTERVAATIWPHLRASASVWARRAELREQSLPAEHVRLLEACEAELALPLIGDAAPVGMMVLARKQARRAVYNLDDVDLLRVLCAGFALASERLALIEREKLLARESAEAQLVALRAQINPHFLFNALNTIAALIEEQPGEAERAVEHLSAIFRHTLQAAGAPTVPLADELDLVGHYLSIEELRFGDRMAVDLAVPPGLMSRAVPAFAVQTLVENAVKHGLEPHRGPGRLSIRADEDEAGALRIAVADTGVGLPALFGGAVDRAFYGIGLVNVAARLRQTYGRDDLLTLTSAPGEGTTATLVLPDEEGAGEGGRRGADGGGGEPAGVRAAETR